MKIDNRKKKINVLEFNVIKQKKKEKKETKINKYTKK